MIEANWIESAGRRDPGIRGPEDRDAHPPGAPSAAARERTGALGLFIALVIGLQFGARWIGPPACPPPGENDVFMATQVRDVRLALDLFKRERGAYPDRLERLIEDEWLSGSAVGPPGYAYRYQRIGTGDDYQLELRVVRR